MTPLQLVPKTLEAALKSSEEYVCRITAKMHNLPMCCSSGLLNDLRATAMSAKSKIYFEGVPHSGFYDSVAIDNAEYIHDVVKQCMCEHIYFPKRVAQWNAMSKIYRKAVHGGDDNSNNASGYSGYKCSNVIMADRIVADKRNPKFKFSSYDVNYSVDHFMDWLELEGGLYGEVLVSKAVPGGHGARCRSAIFTPDVKKLKAWHDVRLEEIKRYVHETVQPRLKKEVDTMEPADKIAAGW